MSRLRDSRQARSLSLPCLKTATSFRGGIVVTLTAMLKSRCLMFRSLLTKCTQSSAPWTLTYPSAVKGTDSRAA